MLYKTLFYTALCTGTFLLCVSCPLEGDAGSGELSLITWNVQNLFDDSADGSEYPDYRPSSGWSRDDYRGRLTAAAELLRLAPKGGADIVLLQEIEHQGVLEDLCRFYLEDLSYDYRAASGQDGSAVQLGVLSRYPILSAASRAVYREHAPPLRPVLELSFALPGEQVLTVFLCHWKSKAGGARESEPYRMAAAQLIRRRIAELNQGDPDRPVLVAGDLNESWKEQELTAGSYPTALRFSDTSDPVGLEDPGLWICSRKGDAGSWGEGMPLYSSWPGAGDGCGSYRYQGVWEQIDHLLFSRHFFDGVGVELEKFQCMDQGPWTDGQGYPLAYRRSDGSGYSDHLPLLARISMLP